MIAALKSTEAESKPELVTADSRSATAADLQDTEPADLGGPDKTLYLTGRPTLKRFLRFVRHQAVELPSEGSLVDEWRAAHDVIKTLEREERGVADRPPIILITVRDQPLLADLFKDPLVQGGFNTVPSEVAMVELDRLVVYQKHIDLTFVRQAEQKLGSTLSEQQIFRMCLPYDHPHPPVTWSRMHRDSFTFLSPSNDLRFLGTMPMQPNQIRDYPLPGDLVGVVGLAVGFGSNFMNAVHAENRLILNNGSHRAYLLRKLGVTHVPCIVQHVSTRDELDIVGSSHVRSDPDLYLKHPRPPMLRDYFDSRLHKVMAVRRQMRQVTVRFEVEENSVPAL